jgi:hypothetical protein
MEAIEKLKNIPNKKGLLKCGNFYINLEYIIGLNGIGIQ